MLRLLSTTTAAASLLLASSANAAILQYGGALSGANESPPVASPGSGTAIVTIDTVAQTMRVQVNFIGLTSGNTAAHIHCCLATPFTGNTGVATITPTFTGFPTGAVAGSYDHLFSLTDAGTYNPAFVTAQGGLAQAAAALLGGLATPGATYLNIHTANSPGGEIRTFLTPVPEPATWAMLILGFGLVGAGVRMRRRTAAV